MAKDPQQQLPRRSSRGRSQAVSPSSKDIKDESSKFEFVSNDRNLMVGQPGSQDGFVIGPNGDEISKYEYNLLGWMP